MADTPERGERPKRRMRRTTAAGLIVFLVLALVALRARQFLPIGWLPEYQNWFGAPSVFSTNEAAAPAEARLTRIGNAIAYDLAALEHMPDPTLAVVGSSVVGPLDERELADSLPGWNVSIVTCNGMAAPDVHLMVAALIERGADAIVIALSPSDFVLADELAPHVSYAEVLAAARTATSLDMAVRIRLGFVPRPYPRARNRPPTPAPGWPGIGTHAPAAVAQAIERALLPAQMHWSQWEQIQAMVSGYPAAVVVLPVHPDASVRGFVPEEIGRRILGGIPGSHDGLALHDLSNAAPREQFSDLVHLRAPAREVSHELGQWVSEALL